MRKGFEGLYGLVRDRLSCEPLSGHLFLFCNAQRNRLKVLVWDGSGLWVCAKRLEKGRFTWPQSGDGQGKVVLSHEELSLLLGGIDLAKPSTSGGIGKPFPCELSLVLRLRSPIRKQAAWDDTLLMRAVGIHHEGIEGSRRQPIAHVQDLCSIGRKHGQRIHVAHAGEAAYAGPIEIHFENATGGQRRILVVVERNLIFSVC